jgi:type III secretion protein Q
MLHENTTSDRLSASARLPRVSVDGQRLHNATYARNAAIEFVCGDETLSFRWEYRAEDFVPQWHGRVEFGGARVWLALEYLGVAVALGSEAAQLLPHALRQLVLLQAFAPALDAIELLTGKQITVTELDGQQEVPTNGARAHFSLRNISTRLGSRGWVQCEDVSGIDHLIAAASLAPDKPEASWDTMRLPLRLELGAMQLACSDLARLEPGDCLLLSAARRASGALGVSGRICGRGGRGGYLFTADALANQLTIVEVNQAMQREDHMPLESAHQSVGQPLDKLDAVELTLTFDLGEHDLSLGEVKRLQPGCVLDLGRAVDDNVVRLRIGGRLVGSGQLVAIGDQLGVRITEFAAGDA